MNPTTNTEAGAVADVAAKLTEAQAWFILNLYESWTHPADIGANANHGAYRDRALIEASTEGQGREYRLTPLGLLVKAHLLSGVVGERGE